MRTEAPSAAFLAIGIFSNSLNRMRIIAGKFRSRTLRSLRGLDIRPTSDRLRETLFNVLTAGNPDALGGSVWLDLFAGTGAVGIESLSRGAGTVYFVEVLSSAADLIAANLKSLGLDDGFRIVRQETARALDSFERQQVRPNFIFLDPPYRLTEAYGVTLTRLGNSELSRVALVVAEHEKKFDPGENFGDLTRFRVLRQGDAALSFYRRQG